MPLEYSDDVQLFRTLRDEMTNSLECARVVRDMNLRYDFEVRDLFRAIDDSNWG